MSLYPTHRLVNMSTFHESRSGAFDDAIDGSYPVVLLTPGQGATAYYSEEVVARDAPSAFPKGTHVYLNHLQKGEVRSPEKILGTLVADTTIREDGAAMNRFLPVDRWAPLVKDVHKIAGLSINAGGTARLGMIDGKTTRIAESIAYEITNSVDLVSYPGRPGSGFTESYDSLYNEAMSAYVEEDHQTGAPDPGHLEEGIRMALEEQVTDLATAVAGLTTLVESLVPKAPVTEPGEFDAKADRAAALEAQALVESAEVPTSVKTRLTESIKDGNYDVAPAIAEAVALREEIKTSFVESGQILGASGAPGSEPVSVKGWNR